MESWLSPMLCGKADVVPEGDDWIAEPKFDGWRCVMHVTGRGVCTFGGRNGSDYSGQLPYVEELLRKLLPQDTVVDGELLGGEWGDVQGIMTTGAPHVPSKAIPALTYVLFDITRIDGNDIRERPWSERRQFLDTIEVGIQAYAETPYIALSPVGESNPATLEAMLDNGMEGIVCKRRDGRYVNTRSNLWIKVKPQDTIDGVCIGFYDPKKGSKYEGRAVGGIRFRLDNGYEGRAAGMDDRTREDMLAHPENYLDRTVELKHHGVMASGALRHPQFLRFRDDKDSTSVAPLPKKRAPRVADAPRAGGPSNRNYGAMGDKKLLKCMKELSAGGDAYDRCVTAGGTPGADLERAHAIAKQRGLI